MVLGQRPHNRCASITAYWKQWISSSISINIKHNPILYHYIWWASFSYLEPFTPHAWPLTKPLQPPLWCIIHHETLFSFIFIQSCLSVRSCWHFLQQQDGVICVIYICVLYGRPACMQGQCMAMQQVSAACRASKLDIYIRCCDAFSWHIFSKSVCFQSISFIACGWSCRLVWYFSALVWYVWFLLFVHVFIRS